MNRKSSEFAIYCSNEYGPVFGNKSGYDICITNNCSKENSCTILNNGSLAFNCNNQHKSSLFNNSNKFTVLDYEVYCISNYVEVANVVKEKRKNVIQKRNQPNRNRNRQNYSYNFYNDYY